MSIYQPHIFIYTYMMHKKTSLIHFVHVECVGYNQNPCFTNLFLTYNQVSLMFFQRQDSVFCLKHSNIPQNYKEDLFQVFDTHGEGHLNTISKMGKKSLQSHTTLSHILSHGTESWLQTLQQTNYNLVFKYNFTQAHFL